MQSNNTIGDYQTAQTLETFGFLPKFSQDDINDMIAYIIANGWAPAIEHEHPAQAGNHYWTMWKLPFFGETNLARVVEELEACRRAYPDHHIRLIGYDSYSQGQGVSFVAYEGRS